jgi:NitT/TauT family transport system permease protein
MKRKGLWIGLISTFFLILAWELSSCLVGSDFILPGPIPVFADGAKLFFDPSFRVILAATCLRGVLAFLISLAVSFALGVYSGISDGFASVLRPWMTAVKATPVVSFILIALLWFGSSRVPVFVAVLMTLPVMTEAIAQGVRETDKKLLEMARVYRLGAWEKLMHVRLPSAMPYFLAGAGSSLGLTWKVVVAGEILSFPKYGIGTAMQTAKVHLETSRVFSLTIAAIALSLATEYAFNALVSLSKRHSSAPKD